MEEKNPKFTMEVKVRGEVIVWVCPRCLYLSTSPFEKCPKCGSKKPAEPLSIVINLSGDGDNYRGEVKG